MSKHSIMKAYFEPKVMELVGDLIRFNFSPESADSIAFITRYSDHEIAKYIDDSALMSYDFTIMITKEYSTASDDMNLEAMEFAQGFQDWLEQQNDLKNFPDFGPGYIGDRMEILQNAPNFAGYNPQEGLAYYQVQARYIYKKETI